MLRFPLDTAIQSKGWWMPWPVGSPYPNKVSTWSLSPVWELLTCGIPFWEWFKAHSCIAKRDHRKSHLQSQCHTFIYLSKMQGLHFTPAHPCGQSAGVFRAISSRSFGSPAVFAFVPFLHWTAESGHTWQWKERVSFSHIPCFNKSCYSLVSRTSTQGCPGHAQQPGDLWGEHKCFLALPKQVSLFFSTTLSKL